MEHKRIAAEYIKCPNCKQIVQENDRGYKCNRCGSIHPVIEGIHILLPREMEECKHAANRIWQNHKLAGLKQPAWKALLNKARHIKILEDALSQFDFSRRVLEIGAGACWASSIIKVLNPSSEIYATDVSYAAILKGKQVSRIMEADIDYFVVCDAENLPFRENLFDSVFGCATLHHLPSPIQSFKEIYRVLKPTGYYLGWGEPAMTKPLALLYSKFVTGEIEEEQGILERPYSYYQWVSFLKKSGFTRYRVELDREWGYKTDPRLWKILYYKTLGRLPAFVLKFLLGSSIIIKAEK